jgi:hypothetical protein
VVAGSRADQNDRVADAKDNSDLTPEEPHPNRIFASATQHRWCAVRDEDLRIFASATQHRWCAVRDEDLRIFASA